MFDSRDFDDRPYSGDEKRIVEYLHVLSPDIGGGDDPIGFLIASHQSLIRELLTQHQANKKPSLR